MYCGGWSLIGFAHIKLAIAHILLSESD